MLITDGRFSGGTTGLCVGHIAPEATEGGPIALVQDGDPISLDVANGLLDLHVEPAELRAPPGRLDPGAAPGPARRAGQIRQAGPLGRGRRDLRLTEPSAEPAELVGVDHRLRSCPGHDARPSPL